MSDWDPALYTRFEDQRTRPARDLLARVPALPPASRALIVDLGCGPGNSTALLAERFRGADVLGVDNSETMLASARLRLPGCRFECADIASWRAAAPPQLIYGNAALQWVGGHRTLIPRLFEQLAPGGVLALQVPDNRDEPSHRLMREVAAQPPFAALIGDAAALRVKVLSVNDYYDVLAPHAAAVDVWRTTYQHPMDSPAQIVEWVSSTGLRPFVDPLPATERVAFVAAYEKRITQAYPSRADGRWLLAFPRLFVVARRR